MHCTHADELIMLTVLGLVDVDACWCVCAYGKTDRQQINYTSTTIHSYVHNWIVIHSALATVVSVAVNLVQFTSAQEARRSEKNLCCHIYSAEHRHASTAEDKFWDLERPNEKWSCWLCDVSTDTHFILFHFSVKTIKSQSRFVAPFELIAFRIKVMTIFSCLLAVCLAGKITKFSVPREHIIKNDSSEPNSVILDCEFEMDPNEIGFVLKWFFNGTPIYQWLPNSNATHPSLLVIKMELFIL